jgi:tetratricopeptide (TPR) repeat protein
LLLLSTTVRPPFIYPQAECYQEAGMHMQTFKTHTLLAIAVCAASVFFSGASMAADYDNVAIADNQGPAYWLDRGGLFATYGNYAAAIEAYQKVLVLDPQHAEAYFDIGVAYGELDEFDSALLHINKAITLDPGQGRYYYGRAWVYLISGQSGKAMDDFKKAAEMGDPDAIVYLEQTGPTR